MKIELRHGSGGEETGRLIHGIFEKYFSNPILNRMEDGAVLPVMEGNLVFTSDSFVVEPLFFPGGDIGRLSICGTVNDLASMGAKPLYLTASFILETGLETETLEKVVSSMADTAKEAGVSIVAGDTKVIEGKGGLYINTAGIGERRKDLSISASAMEAGGRGAPHRHHGGPPRHDSDGTAPYENGPQERLRPPEWPGTAPPFRGPCYPHHPGYHPGRPCHGGRRTGRFFRKGYGTLGRKDPGIP